MVLFEAQSAAFEGKSQRPEHQCNFYLDEFHTLRRMKKLEEGAALLAGLGVRFIICIHSLGQLKSIYGDNYEIFLSNAGLIQAFANADKTTLEYLSSRLGNTATLTRSSSSISYGQQTAEGMGTDAYQIGSHPLLAPHEIERIFGRDDPQLRCLVLRPSHKPAITQRIYLDKHPMFAGRFDEVVT